MSFSDWHLRYICQCGDETHHHQGSMSSYFFFQDTCCTTCGRRLRYSTIEVTCRWVSASWGILKPKSKGRWEYHENSTSSIERLRAGEEPNLIHRYRR